MLLLLLTLMACPALEPEPGDPDPTPTPTPTPEAYEGLADELDALRIDAGVPGAAACVTVGEEAWCAAMGLADVASQRPVEPETPFLLASVTKTVTAAAVMQTVDDGMLELDADLGQVLVWAIHPDFDAPVTMTRLMGHRAAILDNWDAMDDFYVVGGDPTITLEEACEGYFSTNGQWYDPDENWADWAPGEQVEYSNMGVALEAFFIEEIQQQSFDEYVVDELLEPLGMVDSAWWLADFDDDELATPHESAGQGFAAYPQFTFADYPNGGLRASAPDLARFGAAIALGGELGGTRVLSEQSVTTMLEVVAQDDTGGVARGWFDASTSLGEGWMGHDGGEDGTNTALYVHSERDLSVVLLTNGDVEQWDAFDDMLVALVDAAEAQ